MRARDELNRINLEKELKEAKRTRDQALGEMMESRRPAGTSDCL